VVYRQALVELLQRDKNDPTNARQIINGNDDDTLIAGYHQQFLRALQTSMDDEELPPPDAPETEPGVARTVISIQDDGTGIVYVNDEKIYPKEETS